MILMIFGMQQAGVDAILRSGYAAAVRYSQHQRINR